MLNYSSNITDVVVLVCWFTIEQGTIIFQVSCLILVYLFQHQVQENSVVSAKICNKITGVASLKVTPAIE